MAAPKKGSAAAKEWARKMARLRKRKGAKAKGTKMKRRGAVARVARTVRRKIRNTTRAKGGSMAGPKRRSRARRAATRAVARVRRTTRRRGGAGGSIVDMIQQGVTDSAVLVGTKIATRAVPAVLKIDGNSTLGSAVEALGGLALGMVARRFSPDMGRLVVAQGLAGPLERMVRQAATAANVPYVGSLLGDDYAAELGYLGDGESYDLGDLGDAEQLLGGDGLGLYVGGSELSGLYVPALSGVESDPYA